MPINLPLLQRNRGLILLCTLAGMILFYPVMAARTLPLHLLESGVTVLTLAVYRLYRPPRPVWWLVLGLGLVAAAVVWMTGARTATLLLTSQNLYRVPLLALVAVTVGHRVFSAGPLNADRLLGAICVYVLLGLAWANAYAVLHVLDPRAFSFAGREPADPAAFFGDMIYFSCMTLTTVGFGDISPQAPVARALASVESITGVIFVAVVISRLSGVLKLEEHHPGHHPADPNP